MPFVARQFPCLAPDPGWPGLELLGKLGSVGDLEAMPTPVLGEGAKCA